MKIKYILIALIIFLFSGLSLCACTMPGANRQYNLKNVVWQTDENEYGIDLSFTAFDRNGLLYGTLKYGDGEYDIHMSWGKNKFDLSHIGYYGNTIYPSEGEYFDITGYYTIKVKDSSVLDLEFRSVYSYNESEYSDIEVLETLQDKTITIRATDIDSGDYDVRKLDNVMWQSTDTEWKLYTFYSMRNFSVGAFEEDGEETEIAVFWLDGKSFKIYKLKERTALTDDTSYYVDINRIDGSAFIVGTYTNDSKQLNLTYTVDGKQQCTTTLYMQEIDNYNYRSYWYPSSPYAAVLP